MVDFSKHLKRNKETPMAKKQTQALAAYDEELAALAGEYADQEANTGGQKFISTRGGVLTAPDGNPFPNNEFAAIIVDAIHANVFYPGAFDPDSPQTPTCYAFGRDEETIKPHEEAEEKVSPDGCVACPNNQFGSAEKGRGKACANRRRLAVISAGDLDPKTGEFTAVTDETQVTKAELAFLMLAPTSLTAFSGYVQQLKTKFKRPPFAVFTKVSLIPDAKAQHKLVYECLGPVPDELIKAALERNKETREIIAFPFPKRDPDAEPVAKPQRGQRAAPQRATPARGVTKRASGVGGKF